MKRAGLLTMPTVYLSKDATLAQIEVRDALQEAARRFCNGDAVIMVLPSETNDMGQPLFGFVWTDISD